MAGESKKTVTNKSVDKQKLSTLKQVGRLKSPGTRYEEQMISSNPGTVNSDVDPVRDAQETQEDSSIMKRFKIINLVGTGNYARVYRAISASGRELAIKSINLSKTSVNYKQKFLPRELTILRRISHENICKIHEIIHVSDRIFIVMQYCSKGTIADLLHKHGPISEPVTRYLFVPVVDAVVYLHSLDLAHRDLKVENILLDNDYNPKLTDFSYSIHVAVRSADRKSRNNFWRTSSKGQLSPMASKAPTPVKPGPKLNESFCGTLPYLSPEMIKQNPYDAKKTDVWSLGVCLYVILNDRLPFPFDDVKCMLDKQLTKDFKFKPTIEVSDHCKDLVNQMLDPDFNRRISSLEVSKHQWMSGPKEKPNFQ